MSSRRWDDSAQSVYALSVRLCLSLKFKIQKVGHYALDPKDIVTQPPSSGSQSFTASNLNPWKRGPSRKSTTMEESVTTTSFLVTTARSASRASLATSCLYTFQTTRESSRKREGREKRPLRSQRVECPNLGLRIGGVIIVVEKGVGVKGRDEGGKRARVREKRSTIIIKNSGGVRQTPTLAPSIVNHEKRTRSITGTWNQKSLQAMGVSTLSGAGVEGGVNLVFSFTSAVQLRDSVIGPPAFSKLVTTIYSIPIWKKV